MALRGYVYLVIDVDRSNISLVANIPDAEAQYHAHEFLEATEQPKAISISPNEVYSMHALLSQHLDDLVCPSVFLSSVYSLISSQASTRDDTLWKILSDLGGVPHLGNDELNDARDTAIELQLTNRFARTVGEIITMTLIEYSLTLL